MRLDDYEGVIKPNTNKTKNIINYILIKIENLCVCISYKYKLLYNHQYPKQNGIQFGRSKRMGLGPNAS